MPATSFYADAAYDSQHSSQGFDPELEIEESELTVEDIEELGMAAAERANLAPTANRRSTDLVRLYLQEIGRVRLLGRDEEVSEAQKVQRYLKMRVLLSKAAKDQDELLAAI
jgi:RNA polymerase nonessential primary-like sigma factor